MSRRLGRQATDRLESTRGGVLTFRVRRLRRLENAEAHQLASSPLRRPFWSSPLLAQAEAPDVAPRTGRGSNPGSVRRARVSAKRDPRELRDYGRRAWAFIDFPGPRRFSQPQLSTVASFELLASASGVLVLLFAVRRCGGRRRVRVFLAGSGRFSLRSSSAVQPALSAAL